MTLPATPVVASPENWQSLFLLRPEIIFLNHGSLGACPRLLFEEYQRWQLELERQPVEFLGRRFYDLNRAVREALGSYLGAVPDEVVGVLNATTGPNIVARSINLQPGDEILSTDHKYGALDRTWHFLSKKSGTIYKRQAIPVPVTIAGEFVERLWSGVTPRTRVVFLSHITSPTALTLPVKEICRRAPFPKSDLVGPFFYTITRRASGHVICCR